MPSNSGKHSKKNIDKSQLGQLTRQQLQELEEKEKSTLQKIFDWVITILPAVCGGVAMLEYWVIPNAYSNERPYTYVGFLTFFIGLYLLYFILAVIKKVRGDKSTLDMLRYRAPLLAALFLLLAGYDYLTLKTGILT